MKKFILSLLVFVPMALAAQDSDRYIVPFKIKKEEPFTYFNFYVDKIYDKRQMRDNIGTVQTGITDNKRLANFEKSLSETMTEYFNVVLPKKDGARKISLCFYDFFVGEETDYKNNEETGIATAVVDFVEEKEGKLVTIGRFSETVKGKAMDVTGKHQQRIKEMIKRCLNAFNNSQGSTELNLPFHPELPNVKVSASLPRKGVYLSFADALDGNPTETDFHAEEKDDRVILYRQTTRTPMSGYYGFSDGEAFYLNLGKYSGDNFFYKAYPVGRKWIVRIPNRDKALLAAISRLDTAGRYWLDAIPDFVIVLIDRFSGELEGANDGNVRQMIGAYPDLIAEYNATKGDFEARRDVLQKLEAIKQK